MVFLGMKKKFKKLHVSLNFTLKMTIFTKIDRTNPQYVASLARQLQLSHDKIIFRSFNFPFFLFSFFETKRISDMLPLASFGRATAAAVT